MALIKKYQNSFTSGVLSPGVLARTDLQKYADGCQEMVNCVVYAHGGVTNRPGTTYADTLPGDGILIPFVYSVEQAYVLAFFDGGEGRTFMRIYRDGGVVVDSDGEAVEYETPYAPAELKKIKFAQSADTLFLAHPSHPPYTLVRSRNDEWVFSPLLFEPGIKPPMGVTATANKFSDSSGTYLKTTTDYKVSSVDLQSVESVPSEAVTVDTLSTWPQGARVELEWESVPGADHYEVYKNTRGFYEWIGSADTNKFTDDNIEGDSSLGPKEFRDPFNPAPPVTGLEIREKSSGDGVEGDRRLEVTVRGYTSSGVPGPFAESVYAEVGSVDDVTFRWDTDPASSSYEVIWRFPEEGDRFDSCTVAPGEEKAPEPLKVSVSSYFSKNDGVNKTRLRMEVRLSTEVKGVFSPVSGPKYTSDIYGIVSPNKKLTPGLPELKGVETLRVYYRTVDTNNQPFTDGEGKPLLCSLWSYLDFPAQEGAIVAADVYIPTEELNMYDANGAVVDQRSAAAVRRGVNAQEGTIENQMEFAPDSGAEYEEGRLISVSTYPGAVGIYQQRLIFGRTDAEPQTVWMSETGSFDSMAVARPLRGDSAITATVDSKQMNEIRHFIPLRDMLMLTSGAEFKISSGDSSGAVTPTGVRFDIQSYWGSSDVPPIVSGTSILMAQNSGRAVRDLHYQLQEDGYSGNEVSLLAEHLLDSPIRDWAFQQEPYSTVWICLENGKLLTFTYMREQEIWAWSEHKSSNGNFRSVSVIREGEEDAAYFLVKRGDKYFIEYQIRRNFGDDIRKAHFVDCGLQYANESAPIQHVTGLEHLAGQEIVVLADGSVVRNCFVAADGSFDLPFAASYISAGLPYTMRIKTVDPELRSDQGSTAGEPKNVVRAIFRLRESRGLWTGPDDRHVVALKQEPPAEYGAPPPLTTGEVAVPLPGRHNTGGSIIIEQRDPLPLTVLALTTWISAG